MRRIVLQPASNRAARRHYADTVESPVVLEAHLSRIPQDQLDSLRQLYPAGVAPLWGATPGANDVNVRRHAKIAPGDFVLFAADNRLFAGAYVTLAFRNAELARALWGSDDRGQTWELMFALEGLRRMNVSYAEMNSVVGYSETNVVQGFSVLDEDKSDALYDHLGVETDRFPPPVTLAEFRAAVDAPQGPTDREVLTRQRTEQAYLRRWLLPGPFGNCALCGRSFPSEFLVAAHIKKRSACTEAERRDAENIVMPACKFGCDALYEEGWISVDDSGRIIVSSSASPDSPVEQRLRELIDAHCSAFNSARREYFAWHSATVFRR